jgi:hypothetical protein
MPLLSILRVAAFSVSLMLIGSHSTAADLTNAQKKELSVFAVRSMGMLAGTREGKQALARPEIEKLIATGINLNGHLCARVVDIRALRVTSAYEVTCVAYRGGTAKKAYLLEALKGIASEM